MQLQARRAQGSRLRDHHYVWRSTDFPQLPPL